METENNTRPVENGPNASENNDSQQKLSYEDLQNELKKVRAEAASRRIANRELEEKAKRWEEYEESQKTEQQKLQEALEAREAELNKFKLSEEKRGLIKEFGLEDDDIDLLTGSDVESNRKIAERLKAKMEKNNGNATASSRPADLLAGNRGTPVGSTNDNNNFDDFIRNLAKGRR